MACTVDFMTGEGRDAVLKTSLERDFHSERPLDNEPVTVFEQEDSSAHRLQIDHEPLPVWVGRQVVGAPTECSHLYLSATSE